MSEWIMWLPTDDYFMLFLLLLAASEASLTPRTLVIMFVILSKESFKTKAVCYSIKQRIKLLLLQKEANTTMQWSQVKTFKFVFIVWRQFFFCLFLWDKFWCFYHFSELSNLKKIYILFMEIYEPMEKWNFSLTKYTIIRWKRRRKKLIF